MSDEDLLREAEKVDRIAKDLQRQASAARRGTTSRRGPSIDADAQRLQLDGLIGGVEAMLRALRRKYPSAAGPVGSGPSPSYAVRQFKSSLADGDKILADARKVRDDLAAIVAAASASASPKHGGGDGAVDDDDQQQLQQQQQQQRRGGVAKDRKMSAIGDEQLVVLEDEDIRDYTDAELRAVAADARAIRGAAEHIAQLQAEQAESLNVAENSVDGAVASTEAGRRELAAAARYKMSAMVLTAALVGGLVGGPVGAAVGAKSAAGILVCAAAGSATSVVATQQLSSAVQSRLNAQQAAITDAPETRRAIESRSTAAAANSGGSPP